GSEAWFVARGEYILLLSDADAARARDLLRQHAALYPDLAPGNMGRRLAELQARLGEGAP
ncbi:MAG TPA: hypothetical protein DEB06_04985, partial [Phycisphaerales bacterium]|nr:hypothetical protein [Phycisphaerales bacterium]